MFRFLLLIKHRCKWLWTFAEYSNGLLIGLLYAKSIEKSAKEVLEKASTLSRSYRLLTVNDIVVISAFFSRQPEEAYLYFRPHHFDEKTLKRLLKNPSFLMMGVFEGEKVVGYFFLRLFLNKHSFTGYLVDCDSQGQGIAKQMGLAMFHIAWSNGFRTFATVSCSNVRALSAYRSINDFRIIKELPDNYIYIEYMKDKIKSC